MPIFASRVTQVARWRRNVFDRAQNHARTIFRCVLRSLPGFARGVEKSLLDRFVWTLLRALGISGRAFARVAIHAGRNVARLDPCRLNSEWIHFQALRATHRFHGVLA
jgi:hypothetical protein